MTGPTIAVMVVDDQRPTRMGLTLTIHKAEDLRVIAQAVHGRDALEQLSGLTARGEHLPDVVLMDIRMPVLNGIDATAALTRRYPTIRTLVLTTYDQDDYAFGALGPAPRGSSSRTPAAPSCTRRSGRWRRATPFSPRVSPARCSTST